MNAMQGKTRLLFVFVTLTSCCALTGCGDPPLHPITGKVTLGGKPYERLLVYMDPVESDITRFNKGIGETDAEGNLQLASSASTTEETGLAAGEYKVYFNCWVRKGETLGLSDDKGETDNRKLVTEDIVPAPYNSVMETPVTFTVTSGGENRFEFDIPAKTP